MRFKICFLQKNDKSIKETVSVFDNKLKRWLPILPAITFVKTVKKVSTDYSFLRDIVKVGILYLLQKYKYFEETKKQLETLLEEAKLFEYTIVKGEKLPFKPVSLRDASIYASHMINYLHEAGKLMKPFLFRLSTVYEFLMRSPFPMKVPKQFFYDRPLFFMANHVNVKTDQETVTIPPDGKYIGFEFETAIVIGKEIKNATPKEAKDAIVGFQIFNDFSSRFIQVKEAWESVFGFDKAKGFANSLSSCVVTADEIIDRFEELKPRIFLNDKFIYEGCAKGPIHTIDELVSYASRGVNLVPGEVIGTGTFNNMSCVEQRLPSLKKGDKIKLELDEIGELTNYIGEKEKSVPWKRTKTFKRPSSKMFFPYLFLIVLLVAFLVFKYVL